ncbi:MAG: transglycosylase SLT domain-containing protein [Deltaproteobacteria bacterium]|nr:transglycosylase SLT domain-containing protein [Deltaproteobacteria bacterium]
MIPTPMNTETHRQQVTHALSAFFTVVICIGLFHFLIPAQINEKAAIVLAPLENPLSVADNAEATEISQGLLDYIQETRKEIEAYDPEEDALIEAYQKFQQDLSKNAEQVLAKRFKLPEMDDALTNEEFTVTEDIKNMVDFWTYMFGVYTKDHIILYHAEDVGIVYSVLDFSELSLLEGNGLDQYKRQTISEEVLRIKKLIKKIADKLGKDENLSGLTPQEMRLAHLLLNAKDHIDLNAEALTENLKYRTGFAHRFKESIVQSGMYMDEMQRIFEERGLPVELTVIPFIESSFNLKAYSSAGAAGIWQFIEATGKRYLKIDEFTDERYDPILAAYAAATHLHHEYQLLGTWPLTINAYNTGPGRMLQAIKALETTDIGTIIKNFKGAGYGTDSRNYYPEFLAALNVYNNREEYFDDLEPLPLETFEFIVMPDDVNIKELARFAGITTSDIAEMNLPLKPDVIAGNKKLPKGYLLKIKPEAKENMILALQDIHREAQFATHHLVQEGDSLKKISTTYDVTIQELAALNQIMPGQELTEGDIIRLPSRDDFEYSSLGGEKESERVIPDEVNKPVF